MKGTRQCNVCGREIFRIIPDMPLYGIRMNRTEKIIPYLVKDGKYWCKECYERRSK